ncbi:hypothetical protein BDP27DRAFT_1419571 [Rhodocollybia butyracea]|uniref:F-box domain-containing protein n=1 Tax=Rhodocollybia butyracea TaxID=206335 RepID=A0A9P5PWQ2_9AGAR|nr:hypothetical protein BDP27DRAFT_1419571 [Rhodocollybia butyracea]
MRTFGTRKEAGITDQTSGGLHSPRDSEPQSSFSARKILTDEIWRACFTFVSLKDLSHLACVCKLFRDISQPLLFTSLTQIQCLLKKKDRRTLVGFLQGRGLSKDNLGLSSVQRLEKAAVRLTNLSSDHRISQFIFKFAFQGYLTEGNAFLRWAKRSGLRTEDIRSAYPTVRDAFMLSLKSFTRLYKLELLTMYVDANVWLPLETIPTLRTLVLQGCALSGNYAPRLKLDCFEARRISLAGEESHLAHLAFPTVQHMALDFSLMSQLEFTDFTHHVRSKILTFQKLSHLEFTPPEKWIDAGKDEGMTDMPSLVHDFLRLFPNLEKFRVFHKTISPSFTSVAIPLDIFPRLNSLSASQEFTSMFIPDRQI